MILNISLKLFIILKDRCVNMSYIKEVVEKVLLVKIGEEFNIIADDGNYYIHNPFKFTETDLVNNDGDIRNGYISTLITGKYKIERLPFSPKMGESYWTYSAGFTLPVIEYYSWGNSCYDKERKLFGIVFRTEQEAKDYLPTWEKRLEGEET